MGAAQRGRWEVVLDLQRNRESFFVRKAVQARAWGEFDRFSGGSFLHRARVPLREAGLGEFSFSYTTPIAKEWREKAENCLKKEGWKKEPLWLLNPCGLYLSRRWPDARWVEIGKKLERPIFIGEERHKERLEPIIQQIGKKSLNLLGKTSLGEALALTSLLSGAVSEDGGLMHACWLSGVPTVAVLGSSRTDWHAPIGPHTAFFGSEDLECGGCMRADCKRGDVYCLERVSVGAVERALGSVSSRARVKGAQ